MQIQCIHYAYYFLYQFEKQQHHFPIRHYMLEQNKYENNFDFSNFKFIQKKLKLTVIK